MQEAHKRVCELMRWRLHAYVCVCVCMCVGVAYLACVGAQGAEGEDEHARAGRRIPAVGRIEEKWREIGE